MDAHDFRTLVAVFDLPERADRAVHHLLADGHDEERVHIVSGAGAAHDCASGLKEAGVPEEAGAYYEGELRAGRWLVVVSCQTCDVPGVLGAIGRHGGSVRVPPEVRDGRV
ncbi:hypothetical protein [Frigoriglobus tundricola]|uniref:Uncharacterized protein n=1 Tax=Frigoriglobus tundricola TaxID=2774151 RepID=A0A6M5Z364_9BACT|nr:hypothetical protein [Frigoriglobus tundricola]QJX00526.1 hypothetical protein FTUN_8156 [Frigoriglobus tundricola]